MGFVGVVGKAAWLTAISLLVVLVSAVVPSNSAGALADHGDLAEGFVYDALVDIAEIPNVGPAGPMAPAVGSEGAVAPVAGTSGHVYDPNASFVAPGLLGDDFANHGSDFLDDSLRSPIVRPNVAGASPKIQRQMTQRGWTPQMVDDALTTGQSIVVDNVTG